MDYPRDNGKLSIIDRETVFKYTPGSGCTTMVLALAGQEMRKIALKTEREWQIFLEREDFPLDGTTSGLVLMIPRRARKKPVAPNAIAEEKDPFSCGADVANAAPTPPAMDYSTLDANRDGLRTLPFSPDTFRRLSIKLSMHGEIARVVSRADIPVFSHSEVTMADYPTNIIHCRTTNAWGMDLAMTCTYFPHCKLTFATIFGCTPPVEDEILKRVEVSPEDALHPLLVSGIIAELERKRLAGILDHNVDKLETRIIELDGPDVQFISDEETTRKNVAKRNDWLDMSYLRNQCISWNTQLGKMVLFAEESSRASSSWPNVVNPPPGSPSKAIDFASSESQDGREKKHIGAAAAVADDYPLARLGDREFNEEATTRSLKHGVMIDASVPDSREENMSGRSEKINTMSDRMPVNLPLLSEKEMDARRNRVRQTGGRIAARLREIRDENEDRIRECKMRLEGMAMASQWAEGETNVQIAREMRRDSRHMRSIALVTMVFLPGTFFASLFSMTFFNWFPDSGGKGGSGSESIVSTWVVLWVGFTVVATAATFMFWYYFVVYREKRAQKLKAKQLAGGEV